MWNTENGKRWGRTRKEGEEKKRKREGGVSVKKWENARGRGRERKEGD